MQAAESRAAAEQRPSKEASLCFKENNTKKTPNGCKRGTLGEGPDPHEEGCPPPAARKALLNAAGCQEHRADTGSARALSTNRFLKKQNQRHSLSAGLWAMRCPAPPAPSPLDFRKSKDEEKPSCQIGVIWFGFGFGEQQLSPTSHWSSQGPLHMV